MGNICWILNFDIPNPWNPTKLFPVPVINGQWELKFCDKKTALNRICATVYTHKFFGYHNQASAEEFLGIHVPETHAYPHLQYWWDSVHQPTTWGQQDEPWDVKS